MPIIGVVVALVLVASSAWIIVSSIRGAAVPPAAVIPSGPVIYRPQSVFSEPNARTADQEQLRRYFLQGKPDGLRRVLP
jgi:hypothetical protein